MSKLDEPTAFADFSRFVAAQYMRTPRLQKRNAEALKPLVPHFNADAAWGLLRTIFANNIGAFMYVQRNKYHFTYLDSKDSKFITGDQPMLNNKSPPASSVPPSQLEFYYPLSPELALLMSFDNNERFVSRQELTPGQVDRYNQNIAAASSDQVYAQSESTLKVLLRSRTSSY